jgi:exopolyphosphatase / guanosine-5'-triphosphate,3'-diphosphate pyrophosphatase
MATEDRSAEVAAVDLGSNSFHLMVAREQGPELQVLDRLREPVRLAAGLDEEKKLSAAVQERALECLQRFGQRLAGIPADRVRIVGTKTLRKLRKSAEFVKLAGKALGHDIEIISGLEEARLVYAGVTHGLGAAPARRLVVDIGGGSTELIIGKGAEPRLMESVALGCVVHTQRFFADGEISEKRFRKARLAARVELEFLEDRYRKAGWDVAIGASGTVRGAWRVMRAKGWADDELTRDGLEKTVELLIETGHTDKIDYADLREDRRAVFAGGVAVLAGVFDSLKVERMQTSENALREGVIYDLLGRLTDGDIRGDTIAALAQRYGVDLPHAADVEATALKLLDQVAGDWKLEKKLSRLLLGWAARLHECGLVIAHAGYHKHSEYLVRHADLPGFSQTDQRLIAALVRLHRGKFSDAAWADLPEAWVEPIQRLAVLLRVAVLLHRSRVPGARPRLQLAAGKRSLELQFPKGWLEEHPLTAADLELEEDYLKSVEFKLKFE